MRDHASAFVGDRIAGIMRDRDNTGRPLDRVMSDTLPDRLSVDPRQPALQRGGADARRRHPLQRREKTNVEEYCVSEGWIRVAAGKALDRYGNPLTFKLKGTVEPYFRTREAGSAAKRGAYATAARAARRARRLEKDAEDYAASQRVDVLDVLRQRRHAQVSPPSWVPNTSP